MFKFVDISKRCDDQGKDKEFPGQKVKGEVKFDTKTADGTKITAKLSQDAKSGEFSGSIKEKKTIKELGDASVSIELDTAQTLKVEVEKKAVVANVDVKANYDTANACCPQKASVELNYTYQKLANITTELTLLKGSDMLCGAKVGAVLTNNNLGVGGEVDYCIKGNKVKSLKYRAFYTTSDSDIVLFADIADAKYKPKDNSEDKKEISYAKTLVGASVFHKVNGQLSVGAKLTADTTTKAPCDNDPITLELNSFYQYDPSTGIRTRFNSNGTVWAAANIKTSANSSLTLGSELNLTDSKKTKFGWAVTIN